VSVELERIQADTAAVLREYYKAVQPHPGQILVVGCSTSEVRGACIGTEGSMEVAGAILQSLRDETYDWECFLAIQCCEHLNRALVVEREAMDMYGLEEVCVMPVTHAGGALAARAMQDFVDPVVVETISAHGGIDIGSTFIGMHLKKVAVPLRLQQKTIGRASVTAAWCRPKLIGGVRAEYK
jgi:uncharacterized protein (TIGR01440 family)